jgi:hypothetical protein
VLAYLRSTGFTIDYRVNIPDTGITVWRRH